MVKLVVTVGLPASGKTFWAKNFVLSAGGDWKIVCMDDLRAMLDAGKYSPRNERLMQKLQKRMTIDMLDCGYNVIVADTNLPPKKQNGWKEVAKDCNADFSRKRFLDISVEECIKRDLNRSGSVGKDVIMNMYNQFIKPNETQCKQYVADLTLPKTVVVDIDGTLAHKSLDKGSRGWYDWNRVGEDSLDVVVGNMVDLYIKDGYKIVLLSGRDAICRPETEAWCNKYGIEYDVLIMRPKGDQRKDSIVKEELFWQFIAPKCSVELMVDDRQQVVDMWRSIGLKCIQVESGDF